MDKIDKIVSAIKRYNISTRYLLAVISILVLLALMTIITRISLQKLNVFSSHDEVWSITLLGDLFAPEIGAVVYIAPPWDTQHARLYGQSFFHPGMRQRRTKSDRQNRNIVLLASRTGHLGIQAQFNVHISATPHPIPLRTNLKVGENSRWLMDTSFIQVNSNTANSVLKKVKVDPSDTNLLARQLFEYVHKQIDLISDGSNHSDDVLKQKKGSSLGASRALVALLRSAHIPARVIAGVNLSLTASNQLIYWVEFHQEGRWDSVDIVNGYYNNLPSSMVPLRKGNVNILEIEGGELRHINWYIDKINPPPGLLVSDNSNIINVFDLTRLSPDSQSALSLLLLLPIGVLLTEILRRLGGIRTYGVFTPALLALAAVFTDWLTTTIVFSLVIIISIIGRAFLPALNLNRMPRLSIVFTLVVMSMVLVFSSLIHFDPTLNSNVVLLPVVILTALVDRIYTVADEYGLNIAITRLAWTVMTAFLIILILLQQAWGEYLLQYPELHFFTIVLIIIVGIYKGTRLANIKGFGWIKEPKKKRTVTDQG